MSFLTSCNEPYSCNCDGISHNKCVNGDQHDWCGYCKDLQVCMTATEYCSNYTEMQEVCGSFKWNKHNYVEDNTCDQNVSFLVILPFLFVAIILAAIMGCCLVCFQIITEAACSKCHQQRIKFQRGQLLKVSFCFGCVVLAILWVVECGRESNADKSGWWIKGNDSDGDEKYFLTFCAAFFIYNITSIPFLYLALLAVESIMNVCRQQRRRRYAKILALVLYLAGIVFILILICVSASI